jgi:hypothetical protein
MTERTERGSVAISDLSLSVVSVVSALSVIS